MECEIAQSEFAANIPRLKTTSFFIDNFQQKNDTFFWNLF